MTRILLQKRGLPGVTGTRSETVRDSVCWTRDLLTKPGTRAKLDEAAPQLIALKVDRLSLGGTLDGPSSLNNVGSPPVSAVQLTGARELTAPSVGIIEMNRQGEASETGGDR